MAEFVQQSIEEMLPELEQMQRVGLFTAHEARSILRKRKAYEYKLRRRTKQKADFLQYIQYEMNVLALVRKRRENTGYKFKRVEIDVAIIQRIHNLFRLVCYRFQDDVKLWLSHIEFCKKRREKASIGKLYTRMLQVHNRRPDLWISAAKWEVEDNKSMENGRSLLQRGLRFNTTSKQLWQEYFRMELLNAEKMRKRREILGLTGVKDDVEAAPDVVLEGKIAEIVYRKATEALPQDVAFHISLIDICREFPFTQAMQDLLYKDLQFHHSEKEITWDAVARRQLQPTSDDASKKEREAQRSQEISCYEVFNSAVKQLHTDQMWELYLKFCLERLELPASKKHKQQRLKKCLDVLNEAQEQKCVSKAMYMQWITLLQNTGQPDQAVKVSQAASQQYPKDTDIWRRYLTLLASIGDNDTFPDLLNKALTAVPAKDSLALWELGIQWTALHKPDTTEALLERGLVSCREVCVSLKMDYLDWCALHGNIASLRKLYARLSASQPLSVEFFQRYISIENSQAEPKMKYLRRAYEDACREFGTSEPDLWLAYISLELQHAKGRPENAGTLHWRALKALDSSCTEEFVGKYTLLQAGRS